MIRFCLQDSARSAMNDLKNLINEYMDKFYYVDTELTLEDLCSYNMNKLSVDGGPTSCDCDVSSASSDISQLVRWLHADCNSTGFNVFSVVTDIVQSKPLLLDAVDLALRLLGFLFAGRFDLLHCFTLDCVAGSLERRNIEIR